MSQTPATALVTKTPETPETSPKETSEEVAAAQESTLPSVGRGATIVPLDGFEGALTLEDEGLSMTDDDSGRQLFTFRSLGENLYQIRAVDSSGEREPLCWRALNTDEIGPSPILAGTCEVSDKTQQFTVTRSGEGYVFGRNGYGNIVLRSEGLEYDVTDSTKFKVVQ
ncbi:hypothetical protein Kisp01_72570 [Kineosporia sp. NBRC 101677]|uniref:RICIN domain-containing protein n=1 Tax=Kineosporia sp. NBRC 101677 TaxID=3032197 RepID=UPI0024A27A23|nr:hypothetical protein [Kineosporia sp. NBRC 101677]GLY20243.1 hypothetical protein Kisp01_72570 [Kineosporia sp. NBRC 101677]